MQSSQEIIKKHYSNYSNYSKNKLNNYSNYSTIVSNKVRLTKIEADRIISSVADLVDDPSYEPFFFKMLYKIGPSNFLDAATKARQGYTPGRCFVYWLKQA